MSKNSAFSDLDGKDFADVSKLAREEFVLWVREQFPELTTRVGGLQVYEVLDERKEEVHEAAKRVCQEGVNSTHTCVRSRFLGALQSLESYSNNIGPDSSLNYAYYLNYLVELIEAISPSFGGNPHFR